MWHKVLKNTINKDTIVELVREKNNIHSKIDLFYTPLNYIRVVNINGNADNRATQEEKIIATNRSNPILGNPHVMKEKSLKERARVIDSYKKDLITDLVSEGPIYQILNNIAQDIFDTKEKIALSCFCAPLDCHAHLIQKALTFMIYEKIVINLLNKRNPEITVLKIK